MATTLTLMRLQLRMQSMPRNPLPFIGSAGLLYSSPLLDKERHSYKKDRLKLMANPGVEGAGRLLIKKGAYSSNSYWRFYSTSTTVEDVKKAEKEKEKKNKLKLRTAESLKVLLVSETGSISAVTLMEANSIAKKKRLDLVHVVNKEERPVATDKEVYKLVSKLNSLDEEGSTDNTETKSKGKGKDLKTILLKGNTGEHDINSKISMMQKWVTKGHRVRVLISHSGNKGDAESVFTTVESKMKEVEGQIQQKVLKGNEIRFYIGPPKSKSANKAIKPKALTPDDENPPQSSDASSINKNETKQST